MSRNEKLYKKRLLDIEWKLLSDKLKEHSNFTCQKCKKKHEDFKYLDVHHKYYIEDREPWDYPPDAYQVLCKKCHNTINHQTEVSTYPNTCANEMKTKPFILTKLLTYTYNREDLKYNKYFDIVYYGKIIDCGYATRINQGDGRFDYELIVRE